jgi:Glycosyl transferase WecG/TagA/CpsF family
VAAATGTPRILIDTRAPTVGSKPVSLALIAISVVNDIRAICTWQWPGRRRRGLGRLPGDHLHFRLDVIVRATFDMVSGARRQATYWMREHGLEWLFRLVQEPRRLWRRYLIDGLWFVAYLALDGLKLKSFDADKEPEKLSIESAPREDTRYRAGFFRLNSIRSLPELQFNGEPHRPKPRHPLGSRSPSQRGPGTAVSCAVLTVSR